MSENSQPNVGDFVPRVGKLIATEDVTPPPPSRVIDYIFESVSARCELRLRGEVIKPLESYCNWTEKEEGVAMAIDEMKHYAAQRAIGPGSEVEVVVVRVAEQYRMRRRERQPWQSDRTFEAFGALDYGCKRGLPDPTETVVWSSRQPEEMSAS